MQQQYPSFHRYEFKSPMALVIKKKLQPDQLIYSQLAPMGSNHNTIPQQCKSTPKACDGPVAHWDGLQLFIHSVSVLTFLLISSTLSLRSGITISSL